MFDTAGTRMSATQFRAFQATRPVHERWELIDGIPLLSAPAFHDHDRIAGNLQRLLNGALDRHNPTRKAVRRIGIELGVNETTLARLGLNQDYRPEPDLAVIGRLTRPGRRVAHSAYLFAEVVSDRDRSRIDASGRQWLGIKSLLYTLHPWSETVIEIEHERLEVRILVREEETWVHETLTDPEADVLLHRFGLRCQLRDIYVGTLLCPSSRSDWERLASTNESASRDRNCHCGSCL